MGKILITVNPLYSIFIKLFNESKISTDLKPTISQTRATKEYGLEVKAPTGHRSIILPLNSSIKLFLVYELISEKNPLPKRDNKNEDDRSWENLVHRAQ
jgi:hypothetical protein